MKRRHLHDVALDRPDLQAQLVANFLHRGRRRRAGGLVAIAFAVFRRADDNHVRAGLGAISLLREDADVFARSARSSLSSAV